MREASARGPSIDIAEFERRLRREPAGRRLADPLRELARLRPAGERVADPYAPVFAHPPRPAERREPAFEPAQEPRRVPREPDDLFATTDLRGGFAPAGEGYAAGPEWPQGESNDFLDYGLQSEVEPAHVAAEPQGFFASLKSHIRPWRAVAGIAIVGAASVAVGVMHRGGVVGTREIAIINAPDGPVKVQPPANAGKEGSAEGAAVLDRKESAPVARVVSSEEQPVDPAAVAASRAAEAAQAPTAAAPPPAVTAPVAPPQPQQIVSLLPEPKKVKTVSVRPDGTIIANDSVPAAVTAPPPAPARANPAAAEHNASATPKTRARPVTTSAAQQPPAAKPPAVASAEKPAAKPKPETAPAASAGAFAVQFRAAASEEEAREVVRQVSSKYSAHLDGRHPGFQRAQVGDKVVYRVRLAGLSKDEAVSVCEKVKASGGSCFVARQ